MPPPNPNSKFPCAPRPTCNTITGCREGCLKLELQGLSLVKNAHPKQKTAQTRLDDTGDGDYPIARYTPHFDSFGAHLFGHPSLHVGNVLSPFLTTVELSRRDSLTSLDPRINSLANTYKEILHQQGVVLEILSGCAPLFAVAY